MNSNVLHSNKAQFNVLTNEETELVNGGAIIVGFAIGIAVVSLVGASAVKDLKNTYDTNYEKGYREEEYKYRTKWQLVRINMELE